jgi:hypothetical protein
MLVMLAEIPAVVVTRTNIPLGLGGLLTDADDPEPRSPD